mmetsp:Transcript_42710/g.125306  ORF Transcript_42710/g.125306 Transcript_42710/m.125306 type:complete len:91 (+) Transcript_42710:764-1036(+)|eukprot:2338842-Prymnesium_polylepis.1
MSNSSVRTTPPRSSNVRRTMHGVPDIPESRIATEVATEIRNPDSRQEREDDVAVDARAFDIVDIVDKKIDFGRVEIRELALTGTGTTCTS